MVYIYLLPLGISRSSIFKFLKSFLTLKIYLQSFRQVNFTMTLSLFFPSQWQLSIKLGSMMQPIFWKIDSTFVSKFLSSTCRGIPTTSKHSLLEYWAFAQHWRSIVTTLLQSSLVTRLVTTSSLNLLIIKFIHFLKHGVVILIYFILQWQDDWNEFSLQHLAQGFLCVLRHGWHSCKVKIRLKRLSDSFTSTLWSKRVRFVPIEITITRLKTPITRLY